MTISTPRRRVLAGLGAAGAASAPLLASSPARAQAWPSKPIRIICGYPAGGLTDIFARSYGEHIGQRLGQQVVV